MSTRRRYAAAGGVLVTAAVVLSACSGGSSDRSSGSSSSSSSTGSSSNSATPSSSSASSSASSTPSGSEGSSPVLPGSTPSNAPPTVASRSRVTRPVVPPSSPAQFGSNVSVRLTKAQSYNAQGQGPGEISGPAVAFTLTLTNGSGRAIDVGNSVVTAYYGGADTPAGPLSTSPNKPWSGSLRPGGSISGVYCFSIPANGRSRVTLNISYDPNQPVVIIRGSVG